MRVMRSALFRIRWMGRRIRSFDSSFSKMLEAATIAPSGVRSS